MSRRLGCFTGSLALALGLAGVAFGQDSDNQQTTTTTTQTTRTVDGNGTAVTQTTKTIQNADGTSTIIEYPANRETMVDLTPTNLVPGATGTARVMRNGETTTISLNLSGLSGDVNNYTLYAIDPNGSMTALGPVTVTNGVATQTFTTPLNRFELMLSPETNLASVGPNTQIILRSAVPQGFAVIPVRRRYSDSNGEQVKAVSTMGATAAYNAPLLNVPSMRIGGWNDLHVRFTGPLGGAKATVKIRPRSDGATQIHFNFHDLSRAPLAPGTRLVLWAVSPQNTFSKLGQVVDTGTRNKGEIDTETSLRDFGLLVTTETSEVSQPSGAVIGTFSIQ